MAEENPQDMAMEDILSSIKNILETEQDSAVEAAEEPAEAKPEATEVPDADDILELSPDMLRSGKQSEVNLDAELSAVSATVEMPAAEVLEEPRGVNVGSVDTESDPFFAETAAEQPVVTTEPAVEPAVAAVSESEPTIDPEPAIELSTIEPETEKQPATDTADVSAGIINNFAKMFARETASEPAAAKPAAEPVLLIGEGSRTIEDVVASVIRGIIGNEVAANWRRGVDYDALAREEIAARTQAWLDANLPALVEQIVKQEIERVMAKVGRHQ